MAERIFSFDLGSGSIGECVREGSEVKHAHSNLIDADYADIKEIVKLRRQYRTRQAHQTREALWREHAKAAGIETPSTTQPLAGKPAPKEPADERMLREFPKAGDTTIYNSALLRIALLRGQKLAGWQIYKAVRSAIQRRGYDNVPWASSSDKDNQENTAAVSEYETRLKHYFGDRKEFYFPCYYEAYRMGLWSPDKPDIFNLRLSSAPNSAHNKTEGDPQATAPRKLVEAELLAMLENAAKQFPELTGKAKEILYGTTCEPYKSVKAIGGILDQKHPRFDNRIIGKCCLIPRLNTCKAKEPLCSEVKFLLALKNMRYTYKGNTTAALEPPQFRLAYEQFKGNIKTPDSKSAKKLITARDWKKFIQTNISEDANPNETQAEIPQPEQRGRSKFCRPALDIMRRLLLSGKGPHEFYAEEIKNPRTGLTREDYAFLLAMPPEWDKICVPDGRLEEQKLDEKARLARIERIIGGVTNRIVRNRLQLLFGRLRSMTANFGKPDKVFVEVARSTFLGEDRLKEHNRMQKEGEKEWKTAREAAGEQSSLRMLLFRLQNGKDLYDTTENNALVETNLGDYEIDHIVPRSRGGSDSPLNMVLTKHELNIDKGNLTPYEWFQRKRTPAEWTAFVDAVKKINVVPDTRYGKRKRTKIELLTSPEAGELARRNTDLQATMQLEKLALQIVSLFFGWPMNAKDEKRHVFAVKGGLTAEIRRDCHLNNLLNPPLSDEDFKALRAQGPDAVKAKERELNEKNRDNPRHHALDAIVISLAGAARIDEKLNKYTLPAGISRETIAQAIQRVYPQELRTCTPKLRDTMYALRCRMENGEPTYYMTTRFNNSIKTISTLKVLKKSVLESIFDRRISHDLLEKFHEDGLTEESWRKFVLDYARTDGRRIRALCKIDSAPFTREEALAENGSPRRVVGDFMQVGKMRGQYMRRKENHKGQLVYIARRMRNNVPMWKVAPVCVFESTQKKYKDYLGKYDSVLLFKANQTVELLDSIPDVKDGIPKGLYTVKIKSDGKCQIKSVDYLKIYECSINELMNIGRMRSFRNEFSSNPHS